MGRPPPAGSVTASAYFLRALRNKIFPVYAPLCPGERPGGQAMAFSPTLVPIDCRDVQASRQRDRHDSLPPKHPALFQDPPGEPFRSAFGQSSRTSYRQLPFVLILGLIFPLGRRTPVTTLFPPFFMNPTAASRCSIGLGFLFPANFSSSLNSF